MDMPAVGVVEGEAELIVAGVVVVESGMATDDNCLRGF